MPHPRPTAGPDALSSMLRSATAEVHKQAEGRPFMRAFFAGTLPRHAYIAWLARQWHLYHTLEKILDDLPHPESDVLSPELHRTERIEADLDHLTGSTWRPAASLTPATRAYVDRIESNRAFPPGVVAHAWLRFMGNIGGRDTLRRLVASSIDAPDGEKRGLAFTDFSSIAEIRPFFAQTHAKLDALPLSEDDRERVIREADAGFRLNIELTDELAADFALCSSLECDTSVASSLVQADVRLCRFESAWATKGLKSWTVRDDPRVVTRLTSSLAILRERAEGRTVDASGKGAPLMTGLWLVTAVGLAWVATYLAGGSNTAVPHAFYVPIIVAAVRFGSAGAFVTSLIAGIVAGPLMPLDVAAGTTQTSGNWMTRLVIFVVIGQFTAYLVRHSLPSLTTELADRRTRGELRDAIARGQMRVEYQPIVELASGDVVGAEALVRWDHPLRGLIGPDVFVREAERTGCVGDITRFVLTEACTQVAHWRRGILAGSEDFKIAVNLSGADLSDHGLSQFVGDVLAQSRLPNDWLHLEVTETALVADVEAAANSLMALRILGVRLALDDFGTGTSSLAHLHRFPFDVVKIDRLFVERAETHEYSAILTNGIISLTHTMGLTAMAEGIETPAQAQVLRGFDCELAQGFLFSRPLRPENFETFYADRAAIGQHRPTGSDRDTDQPRWR